MRAVHSFVFIDLHMICHCEERSWRRPRHLRPGQVSNLLLRGDCFALQARSDIFARQQGLFPQRAVTVSPELTDRADHTMTGNQYCDGVMPDGSPYGS